MELCRDKSCVLDVCVCDAFVVVCPKAWCVGGGLEDLILGLLLCFWWLPIMGLGTLLLGVVVKGERWCGARDQLQQGWLLTCCRYELEFEVGVCCGLDVVSL